MPSDDSRADLEALAKAQRDLVAAHLALVRMAQAADPRLGGRPPEKLALPSLDVLLATDEASAVAASAPPATGRGQHKLFYIVLVALGIVAAYAVVKPVPPPSDEAKELEETVFVQEERLRHAAELVLENQQELRNTQATLRSTQAALKRAETAYRALRDSDQPDAGGAPIAPPLPPAAAAIAPLKAAYAESAPAATVSNEQLPTARAALKQVDAAILGNRQAAETNKHAYLEIAKAIAASAQDEATVEAALARAQNTPVPPVSARTDDYLPTLAKQTLAAPHAEPRIVEATPDDDYPALALKIEIAQRQLARAERDVLRWQSEQTRAIATLTELRAKAGADHMRLNAQSGAK